MACYRVSKSESAVTIELTQVAGKEEELLGAFAACQAGQCSCPTHEYQKLAAMEVLRGEGDIRLRLEASPGETLDLSEIAACLDYTAAKASETEG